MARIFTTPSGEQTAKAWLHDVTLAAGVRTANQRKTGNELSNFVTDSRSIPHAQKICDELLNRNFEDIDSDINEICKWYVNADMQNLGRSNKTIKPETAAKSLVYMAELLGLYWDDTIRTPFEIDEFKKTLLGTAVYKYGRYISAIPNKSKTAKSASMTQPSSSTSGQTNGQPKNNYKQSGPQSGNVRDLRDINGNPGGTPGHKVNANTNVIYKIIGDNPQSKNIPNVFIKPLSASGATGNTNKIFISSGNGYTDCTCWFDDPNDAQTFLDKIEAAGRVPANISNLRVAKYKADPNGYFIIGTEFGPCAVSAKTLNEALTEACEASGGWEKATEGYSKKELDELHTWMRKD